MTDNPLPRPSLLRHFMALLYDTLLILPLFMAVTGILVALYGPTDAALEPSVPKPLSWLAYLLVLVAFYTLFWRKSGQTLGMQAWRIQVRSSDGSGLSYRQCFMRLAVAFLSLIMAGLGFIWRYVDSKKRYWHDRASATELVLLPKRGKQQTPP